MDLTTYQTLAARTECDQTAARARHYAAGEYPTQMQRFIHGALGIAAEGGELLGLYQKFVQYGQNETKLPPVLLKEKVTDELGDVLWYAALVANAFGLDLGEVAAANVRKLMVRYPEKYDDERAADRDRRAEAAAVRGTETNPPGATVGRASTGPAFPDGDRIPSAFLAPSPQQLVERVPNYAAGRPDLHAFPPRPDDPADDTRGEDQ